MFDRKINPSNRPMSAWNLRSEKLHVKTPMHNVNAVSVDFDVLVIACPKLLLRSISSFNLEYIYAVINANSRSAGLHRQCIHIHDHYKPLVDP
jgi:hypothetical protein